MHYSRALRPLCFVFVGVLASSAIAFVASMVWWNLWMYSGWAGPPAILHGMWPGVVDGETSYDLTFVEMNLLLFVAMAALAFVAAAYRERRRQRTQLSTWRRSQVSVGESPAKP